MEDLEQPIQNLKFLELYHKSALSVESLSKSLKKASFALGILAVAFFAMAFMTVMAHTASQGKTRLQQHRL